jgi:hypothetical protein
MSTPVPVHPSRPGGRSWFGTRRAAALAAALAVSALAGACAVVPLPTSPSGPAIESIFGSQAPPAGVYDSTSPVELGVRLRPKANGSIIGLRFYKVKGAAGRHTGSLWTATGTKLASLSFDAESAEGWQEARFSNPVRVTAGTVYVASYHSPSGNYAAQGGYFTGKGAGSGNVEALPSGSTGSNGVYKFGPSEFPTYSYNTSNYWADVLFVAGDGTASSTTTAKPTSTTAKPSTTTAKPTTTTAKPTTTTAKPTTTTTTAPPPTNTGYPDASNTGVPAGTSLRASGSLTVTTPGAVLDGLDVNGTITVAAANVTIKRSRFRGSGQSFAVRVQSGNVRVEDCDVSGNYTEAAIGYDNWTMVRCNLHHLPDDGVKLGSNVLLQDSYLHDWSTGPGAHADGGQIQNGVRNTVVRHNTIDIVGGNAALFIAPDLGPSSPGPVRIENNLLGGGGYTVFCVDGNNGRYYISDIAFTGNRFKRNATWGPVRTNVPVSWSANVWHDTGAALQL